MIHRIESEFWFGDIVYLKVCDEPDRGMVCGVNLRPGNMVTFAIQWGSAIGEHYGFELTREFVPQYPKSEEPS